VCSSHNFNKKTTIIKRSIYNYCIVIMITVKGYLTDKVLLNGRCIKS